MQGESSIIEGGETAMRVADLFRQALRLQRRASPNDWVSVNLTMAQLKVMFVLHHHGPTRVTDLAEALGVSPPSITGTLDRLVEEQLVERRHDTTDRRLVITSLTAAGQALVERLHQGRRARLIAALAELDAVALGQLEQGLGALVVALEAAEGQSTLTVGPRERRP